MERNHNDINLVIGSFSPFVSPLKGLFLPALPFIDIEFVCVRSLFAFFYSFSTLSYKHMDHALWTQRPISRELICLNHLLFFFILFYFKKLQHQYWTILFWIPLKLDLITQSLKMSLFWHVSFALLWVVLSNSFCVTLWPMCRRKCQPKVNKPHKKLHKNGKQTMLKWKTRFFVRKTNFFLLNWKCDPELSCKPRE